MHSGELVQIASTDRLPWAVPVEQDAAGRLSFRGGEPKMQGTLESHVSSPVGLERSSAALFLQPTTNCMLATAQGNDLLALRMQFKITCTTAYVPTIASLRL